MNLKTLGLGAAIALVAISPAQASIWNFADYGSGDLGTYAQIFNADDGTQLAAFSGACAGASVGSSCTSGPDLEYHIGSAAATGLWLLSTTPDPSMPRSALGFDLVNPIDSIWRVTFDSLARGDTARVVEYGDTGIVSVLATLSGGHGIQETGGLKLTNPGDVLLVVDSNNSVLVGSVSVVQAQAQVPEPATVGLFGLALAGFAAARRRRAS